MRRFKKPSPIIEASIRYVDHKDDRLLARFITDTGKNTSELLTQAIRGKDGEAWAELMKTKTVVTLTPTEKAAWQAKFAEVRNKLKAEGKINAGTWQAVTDAAAGK